jgi:hypothetical protein
VIPDDGPNAPGAEECEWDHCDRPATYDVHAAWTIFDWLDVPACDKHVQEVKNFMKRRTVDNSYPLEVYATRHWW